MAVTGVLPARSIRLPGAVVRQGWQATDCGAHPDRLKTPRKRAAPSARHRTRRWTHRCRLSAAVRGQADSTAYLASAGSTRTISAETGAGWWHQQRRSLRAALTPHRAGPTAFGSRAMTNSTPELPSPSASWSSARTPWRPTPGGRAHLRAVGGGAAHRHRPAPRADGALGTMHLPLAPGRHCRAERRCVILDEGLEDRAFVAERTEGSRRSRHRSPPTPPSMSRA